VIRDGVEVSAKHFGSKEDDMDCDKSNRNVLGMSVSMSDRVDNILNGEVSHGRRDERPVLFVCICCEQAVLSILRVVIPEYRDSLRITQNNIG
jgi:hypothetical protein